MPGMGGSPASRLAQHSSIASTVFWFLTFWSTAQEVAHSNVDKCVDSSVQALVIVMYSQLRNFLPPLRKKLRNFWIDLAW
jgi:hypothetical protein